MLKKLKRFQGLNFSLGKILIENLNMFSVREVNEEGGCKSQKINIKKNSRNSKESVKTIKYFLHFTKREL